MKDTKPVNPGEEIDTEKLKEFFFDRLEVVGQNLTIEQFASGASNLTYCIYFDGAEFVLRRPPFGNQVKSAHDMMREFYVLAKLSEIGAPVPTPIVFCEDEDIIGSEFYLMERLRGTVLRRDMPEVDDKTARRMCESFIGNLVGLHSQDVEELGLTDLGKPAGYARRQVEGWSKRYLAAQTAEWPELESVMDWLNSKIPGSNDAVLIHNDYKFDNLVLDPDDLTKVVGILDWEMATIGCPLMDFGTTLGYWQDASAAKELFYAGFNPTRLMETVSRRELTDIYAEKSGRDLSNIHYYYVFGLFKIAAIAQQIYFRYAKGLTKNERFASFNEHVKILGETAAQAIERGNI